MLYSTPAFNIKFSKSLTLFYKGKREAHEGIDSYLENT